MNFGDIVTAPVTRRSVMTLYSDPSSIFSHRVRIVLFEKDISVEIEDVDPDNKPADLLHLNPYNTVPTLVDRDLVLYDSRVVSEYLDERFPHPPLMPVDPVSRARSRLALYRIEKDWYDLLPVIEGADAEQADKARQALLDSLVESAEVFALKEFFLSDEYSLVDATVAPMLWRLAHYGVELPASASAVTKYAKRMFDREGFQMSLTESEREMR
ncbi:stringent starvation protein A [Chromatiales bacterium (ex Bugula neritina AB1)]|nr:stringent starvation protein A [Chromatiales bacterium (ex Bugula neritina AB1)]